MALFGFLPLRRQKEAFRGHWAVMMGQKLRWGLMVALLPALTLADTPPTNALGLTFLENLQIATNTSAACKAGKDLKKVVWYCCAMI